MTLQQTAVVADAGQLAGKLRRWIASGACQSPTGAFYAWIEDATGKPAFEYPEITGYALTFLAAQAAPTAQEEAAGARAADWLLKRLARGSLFARAGWDGQAVYNFDLAMIATGLMAFGRRSGIARYVDAGVSLARDFGEQIAASGTLGSIPPGSAASARSAWSTEGFAHLVKVVQSLVVAASLGETSLESRARVLVDQQRGIQRPDGRMVTHPRDEETMLHPHLYAAEGLWAFGTACDDAAALERARRATEWVWRHQLDSGGLPRYVTTSAGERGPEQLDATAQAVRMALALGVDADVDAAIDRLSECALGGEHGAALVYQPESDQRHRNTWVTLFGAQAAALAAPDAAPLGFWELV